MFFKKSSMLNKNIILTRLSPFTKITRRNISVRLTSQKLENLPLLIKLNGNINENNGFWVEDPATMQNIALVKEMHINEIRDKIQQVHQCFHSQEWKQYDSKKRHDLLLEWYRLVIENEQTLATIITLENGKPFNEALGEVRYAASFLQWFGEEALRSYGDMIPAPKNSHYMVLKQPVGIVGIITPWNFPLAMLTRKVGAAIAAGCTTIVKPASETPLTCLAFAELGKMAGVPKGVMEVVTNHANTSKVGDEFCHSELINKITFTGSTRVGKHLASEAMKTMKKVSMELGGNAPFIVFEDANLDKAVDGLITGKFRNAGQTCVCPNRIYVHSDVHDIFIEKLKTKLSQLKVGNGFDSEIQIGPLIHSKAKKEKYDLVEKMIKEGAKLEYGFKELEGNFFSPTLLTQISSNSSSISNEIFGPIIPVIKFNEEEEVLKMANDTKVGLAAYFFSNGLSRSLRVSSKIQSGMVGVNTGMISTPVAPFGGVKDSGLGREGSKYGMDDYMNIKFLSIME